MSTNATIIVKNIITGEYNSVYLHWDGDIAIKTLKKHYNNYVSAQSLVDLGDISALYETINCPEGHTFETPVKGCTIFYGRDRSEDDTEKQVFMELDTDEYDLIHVFEDNKWTTYK